MSAPPVGIWHVPAIVGWAQGLQRSTAKRRRAFEPGRSERKSKQRSLILSAEPSGVLAAEQGPTASTLYEPEQFASLALSTLESVFSLTPWRMVEAELYPHAKPRTVKIWPRCNKPGGHGPDSGVPRHQCGPTPSG